MKINEVEIKEGIFSDMVDIARSGDDDDSYETRKKRINDRAKPQFVKDFKTDFYADLEKYLDAGAIDVSPTPVPEGLTYQNFELMLEAAISEASKPQKGPVLDRIIRIVNPRIEKGQIKDEKQLENYLATKFPSEWNPTVDKPGVIKYIWDQAPKPKQKPRLAAWVSKWFKAYMNGVTVKNEDDVDQIANDIEKSFDPARGPASITNLDKLANLAWEATISTSKIPSGAADIGPSLGSTTNPNTKQLLKLLANLERTDRAAFDEIKRKLNATP